MIIICLYIDDMLILGTNIKIIKSTKRMLSNSFDIKDQGVANVILEIKITRTLDGKSLSQSHYVEKMIERFKDHGIKRILIHFSHTSSFIRIQELEYASWSILRLSEV